MPRFPRLTLAALVLFLGICPTARGQSTNQPVQVRLAWDASPSPGVDYILWASNAVHTPTNALPVPAGTNLSARVSDIAPGRWTFYVTARTRGTNAVESVPSNLLLLDVPTTPANFRNVVIQYSTNLSFSNSVNVGFFRLEIP